MKIKINPTRMELLKLKKRLSLARRGYKLLKDKEEQLLIEFRKLISESIKKRDKIEKDIVKFYEDVLYLKGISEEQIWQGILYAISIKPTLSSTIEKVFNIPIKKITIDIKHEKLYQYSFSPFFSFLLKEGEKVLNQLIELSNMENKLSSFAEEIERTRRRVNALEYILIPNLEESIKFITFKLSEGERGTLVRLKHLQLNKS